MEDRIAKLRVSEFCGDLRTEHMINIEISAGMKLLRHRRALGTRAKF